MPFARIRRDQMTLVDINEDIYDHFDTKLDKNLGDINKGAFLRIDENGLIYPDTNASLTFGNIAGEISENEKLSDAFNSLQTAIDSKPSSGDVAAAAADTLSTAKLYTDQEIIENISYDSILALKNASDFSLGNLIGNKANVTDLNNYVKTTGLDAAVSILGYKKSTDLGLDNYLTTANATSIYLSIAAAEDINDGYAKKSELGNYINETTLNNRLGSYITEDYLNNANYATIDAVDSKLDATVLNSGFVSSAAVGYDTVNSVLTLSIENRDSSGTSTNVPTLLKLVNNTGIGFSYDGIDTLTIGFNIDDYLEEGAEASIIYNNGVLKVGTIASNMLPPELKVINSCEYISIIEIEESP